MRMFWLRSKLEGFRRWALRNASLLVFGFGFLVMPAFGQETFNDNALVRVGTWLIKLVLYGFGGFFLVIGLLQAVKMKLSDNHGYQGASPWAKILWGGAVLLTPALFDLAKSVIEEAAGADAGLDNLYDPFGQ